jgi:hypothetical protein
MAWIEQHRRADGGLTARVIWRPGGARDATRVWETFGAGSGPAAAATARAAAPPATSNNRPPSTEDRT